MKPENTFIAAVHRRLPPTLYREKTNNRYRGGTPDVYYEGGHGTILWVEYKWLDPAPVRQVNLTTHLSPLQQRWLRRAIAHRVPTAVIAGSPRGVLIAAGAAWETPLPASYLTTDEAAAWITQTLITSSASPPPP